jgi:TfoX/Sxy family transcriptional regulator of competence genes
VREVRMFGGLTFMVHGHMACGVVGERLMVRVGEVAYPKALKRPFAGPMDFTGRPLAGFVYVEAQGLKTTAALRLWLRLAVAHVASLPRRT